MLQHLWAEWASCRVLTHNCEQMCCSQAGRGYRCSAARKATLWFQRGRSSSEHLDPSKEHLTLCFTVLPALASFHTTSWWSFHVWETRLLLFISPFEMSKGTARTGKHKFYWTDSAANSQHRDIFASPSPAPPVGFLIMQQLTQQICPALCIIILRSLEDRDAVESSFFSKGEWWYQEEEHLKKLLFSNLDLHFFWGSSSFTLKRQQGQHRGAEGGLRGGPCCSSQLPFPWIFPGKTDV